jgi:hypothetical protein
MELPEANEYDKANQRYAADDNKSWQNRSLRLLGSNAVEDVARIELTGLDKPRRRELQ